MSTVKCTRDVNIRYTAIFNLQQLLSSHSVQNMKFHEVDKALYTVFEEDGTLLTIFLKSAAQHHNVNKDIPHSI